MHLNHAARQDPGYRGSRRALDLSIWLLFLLVLALAILPLAWVGARTLFRYRATRVVQCPETGLPAAVHVDGARAALGSAIGGADLRLQSCSRWPERNVCGQHCLSQIETAPADCFARTLLVDWYRGSSCALCGKAIGRLHWVEHKPA